MIETGGHSTSAAVKSPAFRGWPQKGLGVGGSGLAGGVPWLLRLLRARGWANVSQEAIRSPCRSPERWGSRFGTARSNVVVQYFRYVDWSGRGNPRGSDPHVTNRRLTSVAGGKVGQALLIYRRCLAWLLLDTALNTPGSFSHEAASMR